MNVKRPIKRSVGQTVGQTVGRSKALDRPWLTVDWPWPTVSIPNNYYIYLMDLIKDDAKITFDPIWL